MYLKDGCSLLLKVQKSSIPFVLNTNLNGNFLREGRNVAEIKESDVVKRLTQEPCVPLALQFFKSIANSNLFKHTPTTYQVMIRKLARDGQIDGVQYLLQQMKLEGFQCSEDLFISAINAYRQMGLAEQALEMFYRIKEFGCDPTVKIYNHVLDTLLGKNKVQMIYPVYRSMKKDGLEPNVFTYNMLLKALCKNNKADGAQKLLEEMSNRGCSPDAVSYTTVIASMCNLGMVKEAREVASRLEPIVSVYNALLNGYSKEFKFQEAFDLMREMVEKGISPNVISYSTLINSLCDSGHIDLSLSLFAQMLKRGCNPNAHTLSSLVKGFFVKGKTLDALHFWDQMVGEGLELNVVAYNTMIHGFSSYGNMVRAISVFSHMEQNQHVPNVGTYCSLISGFVKAGDLDGAVNVWNKMLTNGCSPNIIAYTSMVQALCKHFKFKEAHSLIRNISKELRSTAAPTFNVFIKSLCEAGRLDCGVNVFRQMEEQYGCPPNIITYNELLDGFLKANRIKEAYDLSQEISIEGMEWSLSTYNTLLHGFCRVGLAAPSLQLAGKMLVNGESPDGITYNTIILAYCKLGKAEIATQILDRVAWGGRNWQPDVISYTNLIWGLCNSSRMEEAEVLLERMIDERILPNVVTWNVIVRCLFEKSDQMSPNHEILAEIDNSRGRGSGFG